MTFCLVQVFVREKPTPDTSQITHKRPIGAEETSSQGEQRLHHQRDMTFYNTLFLNPVVYPLHEVIQKLVGHIANTELPDSTPVWTNDLANILNAVKDEVAIHVLAIHMGSVVQMIHRT
jgi:hypothetical protein